MTNWLRLTLAAAALAASPGVARQAVAPRAAPAAAFPATTNLARDYVRTNKVPGLVIAIGQGDAPASFVSAGNIGPEAGAAPADADSLWRVYSMTKPLTAMAAMMLIEDGRMRLDQPVADFIPAFRNMRVLVDPEHSLESRPATRPITIRNLLTHTAGLGYAIVTTGPLLAEYKRLGIEPYAANAALEADARKRRPATLAEFADRLATLPLIAEPGAKWSYSVGLDLMGRVIEVASGMPFDRFLQTRLFDPLKMRSTYFTVPRDQAGRLATNIVFLGPNAATLDPGSTSIWLEPPAFPYGGAGLVMSARDYDRFLAMLLNEGALDGVRVMKPETVRLATSNLLPPAVDTSALGAGRGFGAGGSVALSDGANGVPRGSYGWSGAAGTQAWIDPVHRLRVTVMANYMPSGRWPIRDDAARAIYADVAR